MSSPQTSSNTLLFRKVCPLVILKGTEKEMTSSAVIAYQMDHKKSLRFGYLNMTKVII